MPLRSFPNDRSRVRTRVPSASRNTLIRIRNCPGHDLGRPWFINVVALCLAFCPKSVPGACTDAISRSALSRSFLKLLPPFWQSPAGRLSPELQNTLFQAPVLDRAEVEQHASCL